MKIAIKQPCFMPYLGYFQVVKYVDIYVFYDDVNYYKGGYINRNNILVNNNSTLIVIPVKKASQNMLINEVRVLRHSKLYKKLIKTIYMTYRRAPFFDDVFPIIERTLTANVCYISQLSQLSIIEVSKYLGFNTKFIVSSEHFSKSRGINKEQRLISICKETNSNTYICDIGGEKIYKKENFKSEGIEMQFFIPKLSKYKQYNDNFVATLSIIDVLMFNSIEEVNNMLDKWELQ